VAEIIFVSATFTTSVSIFLLRAKLAKIMNLNIGKYYLCIILNLK